LGGEKIKNKNYESLSMRKMKSHILDFFLSFFFSFSTLLFMIRLFCYSISNQE